MVAKTLFILFLLPMCGLLNSQHFHSSGGRGSNQTPSVGLPLTHIAHYNYHYYDCYEIENHLISSYDFLKMVKLNLCR